MPATAEERCRATLSREMRSRRREIREAIAQGGRQDRLWLEVLGSGMRLDARGGGRTLACVMAEELLRVRGRDGAIVPLRANLAQLEFEYRRGRHNIVLKARQMGMSTWVAGRMLLRTLVFPGSLSLLVAHTERAAAEMFQTVQRFYSCLPKELKGGEWRVSHANRGQLCFPRFDSEIRIASAGEPNAGRGMTLQNLHCSEVARWKGDTAEVLAGLRAALAPDGEMTMESTPMGAYGAFYKEWCFGPREMVRHFLPWWLEKAHTARAVPACELTEEERRLVEAQGVTRGQIGFRRRAAAQHGRLAAQEFAESPEACFLASGECVFDAAVVQQRLGEVSPPMSKLFCDRLWVWLRAAGEREYVIAVDAAGGGSAGDFSAIQVIDLASGQQVAEWQAHADMRETADCVAELARMYPRATVVVEQNNHGHAVIAYLDKRAVRLYEKGWLTTQKSRALLVEGLHRFLRETPERIESERLLAECRSFVRTESGVGRAAQGSHDDLVIAMALALRVRAELLG